MLLDEPLGLIVERLRRRGTDDASVEVKACTNKLSADVWETVSAFANTAGGLIILGLNEAEGFVPSANFAIDRVRDQFVSGIGDGGSAAVVTHAPRYELDRGEVDGLQVLLVRIFELELKAKPCYIGARGVQNGSYKRVDDKDIKMSPAELYELQSALLPSDADGTVVSEATVEDLDPDVVRSIIANRRLQTPARFARGRYAGKAAGQTQYHYKGWRREARGASVGGNLPPAVLSQTDDRCRRSFRCGKICTRATPVY